MTSVLPLAMFVTFIGMSVLALVVYFVDRLAGNNYVRARHDLALAAFMVAPLIFVLAFRPASTPSTSASPSAYSLIQEVDKSIDPTGDFTALDERKGIMQSTASSPLYPQASTSKDDAITVASWMAVSLSALPIIWLIGTAIALVILVRDLTLLVRLKRQAIPIDQNHILQLTRRVAVRQSERINGPMLIGYFRPSILVPRNFDFEGFGRDLLEHEVAHYVRGDCWTVLGLRLIKIVFWWLVPLKILETIISKNRETLCDAQAAHVTGEPKRLAHALLDTATVNATTIRLAVSVIPSKSALASRIRYLTDGDLVACKGNPFGLPLSFTLLCVLALLVTPTLGVVSSAEAQPIVPQVNQTSLTTQHRFEYVTKVEIDQFYGAIRLVFVEDDVAAVVSDSKTPGISYDERAGTLLISRSQLESVKEDPQWDLTLQLPVGMDVSIHNSDVTVATTGKAGLFKASGNRQLSGTFEAVKGLDVNHSGDGELLVGWLESMQDTELSLTGSGNLIILGGRTPYIQANMNGSGYLIYGGVADNARLTGSGSGSVYIGRVTGKSSLSIEAHGTIARNAEPFLSRTQALTIAAEAAGREL